MRRFLGVALWMIGCTICLAPAVAFWQSRDSNYNISVGGAPTPTTWDPANKSANITLSGGNLTATDGSGGFSFVIGTASHLAGKYYWEDLYVSGAPASEDFINGFATGALPAGNFCGQNNNSVGYDGAGFIWKNGANTAVQAAVLGDTIGYALDLTNSKFWARTIHSGVPGNWNNSGTDNPATNTGGFSFAGLSAGPYFPCATLSDIGTVLTTNFGASAFVASAPAGFGNW